MSKINLTYNKVEYTLEYNRQSVRMMESQGFVLDELTTKPMTMIPMLFQGAFMKNHRIKRSLIDEIFEAIPDKTGLMEALMEMYADTLGTLTDTTSDNEGNVTWAKIQ